jgi:hypothetical protein
MPQQHQPRSHTSNKALRCGHVSPSAVPRAKPMSPNTNIAPHRPGNKKQQPSKSGLGISSSSLPEQQCCSTSEGQQQLCSDPAILLYAKQLDDHRKRCELSGR